MPAEHKRYPIWFRVNQQPYTPEKPKKTLNGRVYGPEETERVIFDEDELVLDPTVRYCISIDYDYSGHHEDRTAVLKLRNFTESEIPNPYYTAQLKSYNEQNEHIAQWQGLRDRWIKEEEEYTRKSELEQLKLLKEKYEK